MNLSDRTVSGPTETMPARRLIRLPRVLELTGLSRTTVYRLEKANQFPAHVAIGTRVSAWVESEVQQWINDRADSRAAA